MAEKIEDNFMVEVLYRDVLGEFATTKNSVGVVLPHWLVPTPNLNTTVSPDLPSDSKFYYRIRRPRPVQQPTKFSFAYLKENDPLEAMVQKKKAWSSRLQSLISSARKSRKWAEQQQLHTSKVKKNSDKKFIYSVGSYVAVAKHLENDPYPHFSGSYNWLYTGGSINKCTVNEEKYLIFPHTENMDTLCFKHQGTLSTPEESTSLISVPLAQGQTIHQVVANQSNSKGLIGVRQKNFCSFLSVKQGSKTPLKVRNLLEIQENDGYFVSIDLNPSDIHQVCTSDTNNVLKLWDLNSSSCTASCKIPAPDHEVVHSSWSFLKYSDKSQQMFVSNRSSVFVKDLRMPLSENCLEFPIRPVVDDCEENTVSIISPRSSLIYAATTHRLLGLDLRFGWSQRWTHLMEGAPMYGSVYCDSRDAEEVVLLSSCVPGDSVAISNKWDGETSVSETFPRGLTSVNDCLVLARSRGKCLGSNFERRLAMATAGQTVLPSECDEGFTLLKITSVGDIFKQEFLSESKILDRSGEPSCEEEIESDIEAWKTWGKAHDKLETQKKHELLCPALSQEPILKAISGFFGTEQNGMRRSDVVNWHKTFPDKPKLKSRPQNFPFEQGRLSYTHTLQELHACTDLMAAVLLQAWDTEGLFSVPTSSKYVTNWLDSVSPGRGNDDSTSCSSFSVASTPSLMSTYSVNLNESQDADESVFKVPSRPAKKIKRESVGF